MLICTACIAQTPEQIIAPVAQCEGKTCTMKREDYEALQAFHSARLKALEEAAEVMESIQAQNIDLAARLNRLAYQCRGRA